MPEHSLDIKEFLIRSSHLPVIDVRSPAEFDHAHIPGAVNLPLLTNEERSITGTLYLKKGSSEAMMKGLEMIGPKLKIIADAGHKIAPAGEALMHCWRGGMRSNSMAWLLNTVGIKTHVLEGGYKSYRRFAQDYFNNPFLFKVIGGMTGSGKTDIIEALENMGHQVIHLERLAFHKGSVFGGIGMPEQPSNEQFENNLFMQLQLLDAEKPVFIEDESQAIGKVFIPRQLYNQMSKAQFIQVEIPLGRRVQLLVNAYTSGNPNELISCVRQIKKRLGLEQASRIIGYIQGNDMPAAVEMILKYYDKIYLRSMSLHSRKETLKIHFEEEDFKSMAEKILMLNHK